MASELRDMDNEVSALARTLAVRTLQLEMEFIYGCLEDEAMDITQGASASAFMLFRSPPPPSWPLSKRPRQHDKFVLIGICRLYGRNELTPPSPFSSLPGGRGRLVRCLRQSLCLLSQGAHGGPVWVSWTL